jgi:hypothetical protein
MTHDSHGRIPAQPSRDEADKQGMDLLAAHVPLTLLIDLAGDAGPGSRDILLDERPSADDLAWIGA